MTSLRKTSSFSSIPDVRVKVDVINNFVNYAMSDVEIINGKSIDLELNNDFENSCRRQT